MKAAFLVTTHHRPELLKLCLESLKDQTDIPAGWTVHILVGAEPHDQGAHVAQEMGATFIPVNDPKVTVKLNEMVKRTDAELVMLADDDDIQPPNRAEAAIQAYLDGYEWSGSRNCYFYDMKNDCLTRWEGDKDGLIGTSMSYARKLLQEVHGWPPIKNGKDGKIAYRIRRLHRKPQYKDISADVGDQLLCLQHGDNIWRRPVLEPDRQMVRGRFVVRGVRKIPGFDIHDLPPGVLSQPTPLPLPPPEKPLVATLSPDIFSKQRVRVYATTYKRQDRLLLLLKDLTQQREQCRLEVVVYDDGSPVGDSTTAERHLQEMGWEYVRTPNHGKRRYLEMMTRIFQDARRAGADYNIFLQDDMRLCSLFFPRVLSLWNRLPLFSRGTMLLFRDGRPQSWTKKAISSFDDQLDEIFWVDGSAFLFGDGLFRALREGFPMPPGKWFKDPLRGSGFGRQVTRTLQQLGVGMYQTRKSYVVHAHSHSVMNTGIRQKVPLTTEDFVDGDERLRELESA